MLQMKSIDLKFLWIEWVFGKLPAIGQVKWNLGNCYFYSLNCIIIGYLTCKQETVINNHNDTCCYQSEYAIFISNTAA